MKTILFRCFYAIIIISLLFIAFSKVYGNVNRETYKAEDLITKFTILYGSDENIVKSVIDCESKGNHLAEGDGGKANGIGQFWEETFKRMNHIMNKDLGTNEILNYKSEYDQIKLLSFAMAHDNLAIEWTSYRAIKNGGNYTFYSKYYKKTITVYCKLKTY